MLRPRAGGFCYSTSDMNVMHRDAELLLEHGADGLAFGILTPSGHIDVARCRELVRRCHGRQVVFHRAFDFTPDPLVAMEQLIDLGAQRILTSGQARSALEGADRIAEWIDRAAGRIEVLPAAGIRGHNVAELVARTGCEQVHASLGAARSDVSVEGDARATDGSSTAVLEGHYDGLDPHALREMTGALRRIHC